MGENWLSNAYEGMSRRQFLARMSAAGIGLAGFAMAAESVAGEVIATPSDGIIATDGLVSVEDFKIPFMRHVPQLPENTLLSSSFRKSSECTSISRMSPAALPGRVS